MTIFRPVAAAPGHRRAGATDAPGALAPHHHQVPGATLSQTPDAAGGAAQAPGAGTGESSCRPIPGANRRRNPRNPLVKFSLRLGHQHTSVCVERTVWRHLKRIAGERRQTLRELIADVDLQQHLAGFANLSSALRMTVIEDLETRAFRGVFEKSFHAYPVNAPSA